MHVFQVFKDEILHIKPGATSCKSQQEKITKEEKITQQENTF